MNEPTPVEPMMDEPTAADAVAAMEFARAYYRRVLATWAGDLLALRRARQDRPCWCAADAVRSEAA